MIEQAEQLVDEYMAVDDDDDADHLSQAIDIYLKRDRPNDVLSAFTKLAQIDPGKAAMKSMFDDALRKVVSSNS
jgi:hypothetical protein